VTNLQQLQQLLERKDSCFGFVFCWSLFVQEKKSALPDNEPSAIGDEYEEG